MISISSGFLILILFFLHRYKRAPYLLIANIALALYLLTLITVALATGSIRSPTAFWLPVVLVVGINLLPLKHMYRWVVITISSEVVLSIIYHQYPTFFDDKLKAVTPLSTTGSLIILTCTFSFLALLSEHLKEKLQQETDMMNKELERNTILAELGEVSAGIAHEINNPLQIINGQLTLLNRKSDGIYQEDIQNMKQQIKRVSTIINGLKTLSRDGEKDIPEIFNIMEEIDLLLDIYETRLKLKEISLIHNRITQDYKIKFKRVQFQQICSNLLNNAVDFLYEHVPNKREIFIDYAIKENHIEITISNSGPPINTKIAKHIFTPFYTTKDVGKGTGLGLSIAQSLAQQNKGNLRLEIIKQKTAFILSAPRA